MQRDYPAVFGPLEELRVFVSSQAEYVFPLCVVQMDTLGLCVRAGLWGMLKAQERRAVLLQPVQAYTPGDKHVLRCQERTKSRLSLSPMVLKGKHPLHC